VTGTTTRVDTAQTHLLLTAITGGLGCGARALVRDACVRAGVPAWISIVVINVLGAAAIGAAMSAGLDQPWTTACAGFLAGWTTYSAFSVDVVLLWTRGRRLAAAICWTATLVGAPLAAWGVHVLVQRATASGAVA
jgi:CrcB protein